MNSCHTSVPAAGGSSSSLMRHDPLEADLPAAAVLGLEVVLVLGSHLDRAAQRGLLVVAVDEDHPILHQVRHLVGAEEICVAELDG